MSKVRNKFHTYGCAVFASYIYYPWFERSTRDIFETTSLQNIWFFFHICIWFFINECFYILIPDINNPALQNISTYDNDLHVLAGAVL